MASILLPDAMYDRRANILVADVDANYKHLYRDDNVDCIFCRERAYRTCAIQLLASILDGIGKCHAERQSIMQNKRNGTNITELPPRLRRIKNKMELPNWVRRPDILEDYLKESVVGIIKQVNNSRHEPDWGLTITTRERAKIIHAHIQRRFNARVQAAVERRRPMAALFHVFDMKFAATLRSMLNKEMAARRNIHPSTWNQICGIWLIVECVLLGVLTECEKARKEPVPQSMADRVRDRLNRLVDHGAAAARTNLLGGTSGGLFRLKSWGKYSV